jgi:hypothetical protein
MEKQREQNRFPLESFVKCPIMLRCTSYLKCTYIDYASAELHKSRTELPEPIHRKHGVWLNLDVHFHFCRSSRPSSPAATAMPASSTLIVGRSCRLLPVLIAIRQLNLPNLESWFPKNSPFLRTCVGMVRCWVGVLASVGHATRGPASA